MRRATEKMKSKHKSCRYASLAALIATALTGSLCAATEGIGDCAGAYAACLEAWKQERVRKLKSADGYLNLAGLYWLRAGSNTVITSYSIHYTKLYDAYSSAVLILVISWRTSCA